MLVEKPETPKMTTPLNKLAEKWKASELVKRLERIARNFDECNDHAFARDTRKAIKEITRLRAEVERLGMQLVGCEVISRANTRNSARQERDIHSDYQCPAIDAVAEAVDREMDQRERAEAAEQKAAELQAGYSEAIDDIQDWAAYASEYFQNKHDLAGCISRHKARLDNALNLQHKPTETDLTTKD